MDRLMAMETYISVVEMGSFSGAARRLKLGQPAVSKTIARLEEHLGARLLLRSTRGLTPTDAGQRFYEHAKRVIDQADEAEQAVQDTSRGLSGTLRVSAPVTFARLHILPALQTFLDKHPNLNIDLSLDDHNIDLLGEGTDVALRMGELQDSSMTARHISQSRRLVVGTPRYFSRTGIPQTPTDLAQHQAIVYVLRGGGESWSFSQNGREVAMIVSGRIRVNAAEGIRTAVLADMGIAVASVWMFSEELAQGQVQVVLPDWELPPIDLWAVFPSGRLVSAKARAFVDFVDNVMAR
ncbi:LysR substrate-binding domain-containing protein [Rouxiella sp. Mn2063]|uniref:LysR family transcriptional regulator n=1 Tax=Rouxiella sp. Mn2063 TaxID=3395262 RepID=UPI003BD3CDBA